MADPELSKCIKQTQDVLGKYVKKPPLSEKNLGRPPFRFLHDIVLAVINGTGFLNGVFTSEELDSANITTRESKTEFVKKLISAITEVTGEPISAKVSKILAGQEPEKTNLLLQSLGKAVAISKSGTGAGPSKSISNSTVPPTKSKSIERRGGGTKGTVDKKQDPKALPAKKGVTPTTKSVPQKAQDAKGKKPGAGGSGAADTASEKRSDSKERRKSISEQQKDENKEIVGRKKEQSAVSNEALKVNSNNSILKRQNSSITKAKAEDTNGDNVSAKNLEDDDDARDQNGIGHEHGMQIDSNPLKHDLEESLSTSPVLPDDSSIKGFPSMTSNIDLNDIPHNTNTFSSSDLKQGPSTGSVTQEGSSFAATDAGNQQTQVEGSTFRSRPGTSSNRLGTARPPSARPAPPRPRSSLFKDNEESNYRPPTGKVSHVLLDNSDIGDDDDNFVVRESTVALQSGLGNLDEAPELALTASKFDSGDVLDDLAPEQRGLLVNQILETQRELENKDGDKKNTENDFTAGRSKEASKAEVEKLKNLLQECARNANPLGKLLDYVREDIDTMQKEVAKWRDESRLLDAELEQAKGSIENSLQPLHQQFTDVEARIADKEDAIAATKMSILRLEERIEKILSGLDRVQSSHGKIQIPSATELLKNEKRRESNFDQEDSSYSPGFGVTLNKLAKSTPGMRPIGIFSTQAEDLDPDNFDPFTN